MSDDIPLLFRHSSRRVRRSELRAFLAQAAKCIAPGRAVVCLITGDRELRRLNREFRGIDSSTDVLSFPSETGGELAVSLDRAIEQAREHGHSVDAETRILILHGLLHLSGMDHETDAGEMARAETRWRKKFGLPCGLIERAHA